MKVIVLSTIAVFFSISALTMEYNSRFAGRKNELIEKNKRYQQKLLEINKETGQRVKAIMRDLEDMRGDKAEISAEISDIFCFTLFIATHGLMVDSYSSENQIIKTYKTYFEHQIYENTKALRVLHVAECSDYLSDKIYEIIDRLHGIKQSVNVESTLRVSLFIRYLATVCSINYGDELTKQEIDCAIKRKDETYTRFLSEKFSFFLDDHINWLTETESRLSQDSLNHGFQDFVAYQLQYLETELSKMQ